MDSTIISKVKFIVENYAHPITIPTKREEQIANGDPMHEIYRASSEFHACQQQDREESGGDSLRERLHEGSATPYLAMLTQL